MPREPITTEPRRKKLGLALGAGSTKGFAHIGVLMALDEAGVKIDMIAGSSMGAIVGSIYSVGGDMRMLTKFIETLNLYSYLDLRNPLSGGGLVRGQKLEELLKVFTHGKTFAQTNTPFCCVACDAETGKLDVLESGLLHEAVRASMSIPAIFEPMALNGKTYIDGGVLERVPCKALRDRGMDVVVGVDVGYHGDPVDVSDMSAYQLLNRTISIMQWEMTKYRRAEADLMLVPEVLFVKGRFATNSAAACIEEGRLAAREAIPRIRALLDA